MMKSLLFFQVHKSKFSIAQKLSVALPISIDSESSNVRADAQLMQLPSK
jgi:hypothetical protein